MRTAVTILAFIQERGKKGLPLERVYRLLFNRDLYLMAYGKIYRKQWSHDPRKYIRNGGRDVVGKN